MSTRTYSTESERQAALAEARAEYVRTGVFRSPQPAERAAFEATRHGRAAFGVSPRPAPAPAPAAGGVDQALLAAVVQEAAAHVVTGADAQGQVARRLREAGASHQQVTEAMRRVQDERARQRDPGW
jgi:hypothetical protein